MPAVGPRIPRGPSVPVCFGQIESRFQNKVLVVRWHAEVHLYLAEYSELSDALA